MLPASGRQPVPAAFSPEALEAALAASPSESRDLIIERQLALWVSQDAQAAARFAELQMDPFLREVALRTVLQGWAHSNPDAAAQWASSLGDRAEHDRAIEYVSQELAAADAAAALDLLDRRNRVEQTDIARVAVIASWAGRDLQAAQAWTAVQPESPTRDEIVQRLVFLQAATDPAGAAQFAQQMLTELRARQQAYASIAGAHASDEDGAADR